MLILGTTNGICDIDAGINSSFVDIKATTVKAKDFERQNNNLLKIYSYKTDRDWLSSKIEST